MKIIKSIHNDVCGCLVRYPDDDIGFQTSFKCFGGRLLRCAWVIPSILRSVNVNDLFISEHSYLIIDIDRYVQAQFVL